MLDAVSLNPPKDIAEKVQKEVDRAEFFLKSRKLRLSEEKKADIERELNQKYESWKKQTNGLRKRLTELNDLLEGVVQETNFPFEGASNITIHYAAATGRTFRAVVNKTMFQDPNVFLVRQFRGINDGDSQKLETFANYTFNTESNGLSVLKSGTVPLYRDGTMIFSGHWERRIERGNDVRTYDNAEKFMVDYPSAEDAGVSEEQYGLILDKFLVNEEMELRVDFSYDFIQYEGPEYEIIPFPKFVFFPSYSPSLSRMEGYGKYYYLSDNEIKQRGKRNHYYKDSVDRLMSSDEIGLKDYWTTSRNYIEGIQPQPEKEKRPYEMVDLVWRKDLDGDGVQEKYLVTYSPNKKILMSMEPYPIRRNIDMAVEFRFIRREDRFPGVSLLGSCQDLFNQLDVLHRHRNNIRQLVASPVFVANKKNKEDLDFGRFENIIKPGTAFWVDDISNGLKQLQLTNLDQPGNSLDEENLITRYVELSIGTTQGLSGKQTPDDPRAPMGKTIALLNQANQRMDDYIEEHSDSVPRVAELHVALYAQYGPTEGSRFSVGRDGKATEELVPKELLMAPGVKWGFPKRSVTFSPEYVMKRIGGLMAVYAQLLPLIMQKDAKAIEMWNRMVISSGEPDAEKLLIDTSQGQQIPAILQEILNSVGKPQTPGMPGNQPMPGIPAAQLGPGVINANSQV